MAPEPTQTTSLSPDQRRSLADRDWWESFLPEGWTLYGWSYRHRASAYTPNRRRLVELDPEFLCAMTGRSFEKETS